MTREQIIDEIRRTAAENGGKPLGVRRFEQATAITPYDWVKYWPRFSDAQREAGFQPNRLNQALPEEYLFERVAELIRELGTFPTTREMQTRKFNDPTFPDRRAYERLGNKNERIRKVLEYCRAHNGYDGVIEILEPLYRPDEAHDGGSFTPPKSDTPYGFVYLVQGHRGEYKIGRTNLVDRRLSELGATSAVEHKLIHEIKTDDPVGVEAYWHRRFAEKRMRGEWFKLTASDVRAFKRWKRVW